MTYAAASPRGRRLRIFASVAILVALSVLTGIAGSAESQHLSTATPTDGQTVSGKIAWTVSSNGKTPDHVDFSVDGTYKWTERTSPYDFNGTPDGELDTTTLADGHHTLSAESFDTDGSTLGETSITVKVANGSGGSSGGGSGSGGGGGGGTGPLAPVSNGAPAISGFAGQGQQLTASTGTWTNSPTGYGYQWQRCNTSGASCTGISGASGSTYVLTAADAGSTVRVQVTASNAAGQGSATSSATAVVDADLARGRSTSSSSNESSSLGPERAVDGNGGTRWSSAWQNNQWWQVDLGSTGTVDTVAVNWEVAYAASWKVQVSTDGVTFTDAASLTGSSHGWKLASFAPRSARYVRVLGLTRATVYGFSFWDVNVYGTAGSGGGTTPPPPTAPSVVVLPTVSGAAQVGSTLQATTGTWNGAPTAYAYRWKRCDAVGNACAALVGAATAQYTSVSADAGATLRVDVTATNAVGSSTATSAATAAVTTPPPTGTVGSKLPARLGQSTGGQYFVDGLKGSDSNPGTLAAPWRTINKAWLTVPLGGSIINVRAGTYTGQVNLTNRTSSAGNPITVRAYPGETVKLTNSVSGYPVVYVWKTTGVRLQGFDVSGSAGDGVKVDNGADVEIVGNAIHNNGMQGVIVGGSGSSGLTYSRNVQLWSNRIYGNGGYWPGGSTYYLVGTHGVYYGNTTSNSDGIRHGAVGGVIANNLFYDQPYGYHIQVGSQNDGLIITSNTFDNAYQSNTQAGNALQIYGEWNQFATKNLLVVNNIIASNSHRGVHGSGPSMTSNIVRQNMAYSNPMGDFVPVWGSSTLFTVGSGNVSGLDPAFVNRGAKDFRLQSSSPAIGRSDPAYAPTVDFAGKSRDSTPDLGAFEY
jgi:F5/8 type C domain-containing protein/parallel beta helix pectate lyase-like protein